MMYDGPLLCGIMFVSISLLLLA